MVRDDVQCSGVASVSVRTNSVYFSGSEEADQTTYQSALRFDNDLRGRARDTLLRLPVGPSFETSPGAAANVFDQGNNIIISDDTSITWPSDHSMVRVRQP